MAEIPVCKLPGTGHADTNEIINITESDGENLEVFLHDTGKWIYMADPNSKDWGSVLVDCSHTNIRGGQKWHEY